MPRAHGCAGAAAVPHARMPRQATETMWVRNEQGMSGWRRAVPTVAALMLVASFCALGAWQLQRADEKRELQADYDRRASQAAVQVGQRVQPPEALQFYRVEARGVYDVGYQVLLDNRVHDGVPGYHVLTPLRIGDGETRVLINRGWVPLGADRRQLPVVDPPAGTVAVRGLGTVPRDGLALGQPPPLAQDRPVVWAQFNLARYAAAAPFALQPVVVLLDPASDAGGYVRVWARLDAGIAVHQGYAFQWFALALAAVVGYIVLTVRAARRGGGY
jgi:surfeit locus 1 family protein